MGKTGGCELNYISDVDVIFVAEPAEGVPEEESTVGRHRPRDPADADLLGVDRRPGRCGRSTRRCAPRARTGRWCAPWPATAPTTSGGPRPGSSRRCSRPAPSPAIPMWDRPTAMPCSRWCGRRRPASNFVDDVQAMRRRVEQHIPAGRGRPPAQARPGRAARRRVLGAAAPARARSGRRVAAHRHHPRRAGRAVRRGLRGARGRRDARHGIPAAAHPRAPHPAVPAAAHPPDAHRRERPAPAGPGSGTPLLARRGGRRPVARPAARGAPPARADLLPPAAVGGGPAVRLRRAPHPRGGPRTAVGAGLPRPPRRAAPPRGAHRAASAGGPPSSASCCR